MRNFKLFFVHFDVAERNVRAAANQLAWLDHGGSDLDFKDHAAMVLNRIAHRLGLVGEVRRRTPALVLDTNTFIVAENDLGMSAIIAHSHGAAVLRWWMEQNEPRR